MVFKKEYIKSPPEWFKKIHSGDYALQLLLAHQGSIRYINEIMSVYRKHIGSLSAEIGENMIYVYKKQIKLLMFFNEFTDSKYKSYINKKIFSLIIASVINLVQRSWSFLKKTFVSLRFNREINHV